MRTITSKKLPYVTIIVRWVKAFDGRCEENFARIDAVFREKKGVRTLWKKHGSFFVEAEAHAASIAEGVKLAGRTVSINLDKSVKPLHIDYCSICGAESPPGKNFHRKHRCKPAKRDGRT